MTNVDFGRYKRIVQYFWDPEPTNVDGLRSPVWCLGRQYVIPSNPERKLPLQPSLDESFTDIGDSNQAGQGATPPESMNSSVDSALAYDESTGNNIAEDGGWPAPFLDDFEARIWLTYRSSFPAIARSQDPKALSAMTFSVRLRSQLVDQNGFTSDTGWGCMIRSGQSLLANAILIQRLGRGMKSGQSPLMTES
jgi:cysteine protease ATG4